MKIINIVDSVERLNFGVWHAAISTSAALESDFGIGSEVWYPVPRDPEPEFSSIQARPLKRTGMADLDRFIDQFQPDPATSIIQTHGTWRFQTVWGAALKRRGFAWVVCPQGMLEPWSMRQKWLQKLIYSRLFEFPRIRQADLIRAVSQPELTNLNAFFPAANLTLIPNGVEVQTEDALVKPETGPTRFVFLGRLHKKKGVLPLVQAWTSSELSRDEHCELIIAGPDQGELTKLEPMLQETDNLKYVGPVFGEEKRRLLESARYFVLPSFSEGFPSSTIEAINHGLVPLISDGCNFPELFAEGHGIKISTAPESIQRGLLEARAITPDGHANARRQLVQFVRENYSLNQIARLQAEVFGKLLA